VTAPALPGLATRLTETARAWPSGRLTMHRPGQHFVGQAAGVSAYVTMPLGWIAGPAEGLLLIYLALTSGLHWACPPPG
jgi:hypothetical protein